MAGVEEKGVGVTRHGSSDMAEQTQTVWQTLARARWGWPVEGDGRFAVLDQARGRTRLFAWHMEAEAHRRELPWLRKLYLLEHQPAPEQITRMPGDWED
jgi:hypothetical protein